MLGYNHDLSNVTIIEAINFLQKWVLINSLLYYEGDKTMVSDSEYDSTSKKLVKLMGLSKLSLEDTRFGYVFYDFDGHTGFDLFYRLTEEDKKYINNYSGLCIESYQKRVANLEKKNKKQRCAL